MECLTRLVGLNDGCNAVDPSKIYVNNAPGWDSKLLGYLTTDERPTPGSVFAAAVARAAWKIMDDWRSGLAAKISAPSVLDGGTAGIFAKTLTIRQPIPNVLAGVKLTSFSSAYVKMKIFNVSIFWPSSVSTTLYIYNINTGELLASFPVDVIGGTVTQVPVNFDVRSMGQRINVGIVMPAIHGSYDTTISGSYCCGPQWHKTSPHVSASEVSFNSSSAHNVNDATSIGHTNGISVNYSLLCDEEALVCQYAPRISRAMLYATIVEISFEALMSQRINSLTTYDRDKMEQLHDRYAAMYNTAMADFFQNMRPPNDACFSCNPSVRVTTSIR